MKSPAILKIVSICLLSGLIVLAGAVLLLRAGATAARPEPEPTVEPVPSLTPQPSPTPTPTPSPTPEPTPEPTSEPEPEYFVLSFVGDCTLASSQHIKGNAVAFERVVGDDYAYPFAKTVQYFENDYLSVANMEGAFTTAALSNGQTFTFKSDPVYANVFAEGSVELVTLGNNHAGDYLAQGREDTKAALDAAGVLWADEDGTRLFQRDGGPIVGVYSKLYPTADQIRRGVAALREAGAEIIIAAPHWGLEKMYQPTADQIAVGHAAIDAGADIVFGCHPHVLQKTEEYAGGCILYSLGNWSFGGHTNPGDKDTAIARITVKRDIDGTLSLDGLELIPCRLSGSDSGNDYQPRPVDPETEPEVYARILSKLDGSYNAPYIPPDYSAYHPDEETEEPPVEEGGGEDGGSGMEPSGADPAGTGTEAPGEQENSPTEAPETPGETADAPTEAAE